MGLLVLVADSGLALDVLDTLSVDIVDLDDLVGDVCVVLVLVGDDSLCVQMVAVDGGDGGLVECGVVVVLSDDCLQVRVVGLNDSLLSWELNCV